MDKFKNWTPELAYFLGWMITDGYVSPQGIHIEIATKDKESLDHLHEWIPESSLLGPYTRIKDGKETESFRLTVNGKEIRDLFVGHWGILPNKTGEEYIPFEVPEDMMSHFFRGLFDGDGYASEKSRGDHEASFCSASKKLLEQMKILYGGNEGRKVRLKNDRRIKKNGEPRMPFYAWDFGKPEATKLRDFIYVENHYGMSRKKKKMFRLF